MKFSYSAVWDDAARLLRANASLLLAVAGVFLFLPSVLTGYFAPQPTGSGEGPTLAMLVAHINENWPLLLVVNIVGFVGNLALLILALDDDRPTVGAALKAALLLVPLYFLVSLMSGLVVMAGLFAFIVPGLYLMGRVALTGPVIVAEGRRGPIAVIRRSFAVTKGHGWAMVGLILIVVLTFFIVSLALTTVFGSIFLLFDKAAGGGGVGALLLLILDAAVGTIFNTVLIVLLASLYRRLASGAPSNGI